MIISISRPRRFQKIPKDGSDPQALKEGEEYFFCAYSSGCWGTRFKIENGKIVVVH